MGHSLWAFRLEKSYSCEVLMNGHMRHESWTIAATGVLLGLEAWRGGMAAPKRLAGLEKRMAERHGTAWRRLDQDQALGSSNGSSATVVMANRDDPRAMTLAVDICKRHSALGALTIVLAARPDDVAPGRVSWAPSDLLLGQLRRGAANCLLQTFAGDPVYQLAGEVERFCSGGGLVTADLADIRAALGAGRLGWASFGVAHGNNRAALATGSAIEKLRQLGADPRRCAGVLALFTTCRDVRLRELQQATRMLGEFAAPSGSFPFIFDHEYRSGYEPFFDVRVMVTSRS